jgi:hypothetical protein
MKPIVLQNNKEKEKRKEKPRIKATEPPLKISPWFFPKYSLFREQFHSNGREVLHDENDITPPVLLRSIFRFAPRWLFYAPTDRKYSSLSWWHEVIFWANPDRFSLPTE